MRAHSSDRHQAGRRRWADGAYRLLLRLYPRAHRQACGTQMLQTFRDHYRDVVEVRGESGLRFWWGVLSDSGRSLLREHLSDMRMAFDERTSPMKTEGSLVLAVVAALLLLLGLRVWLSPAVLSAPHGGSTALGSVVGLALLLLAYAMVALFLIRARLRGDAPWCTMALRRATLLGALLGGGVLAAIAVETLVPFESPLSLAIWGIVALAAPLVWAAAGLMATRAGGATRLGVVAALWCGMVSALVGAAGELASTMLALPRLVQHQLSNPDYLLWHQPDVQSYAIASALALGMIGLILAPIAASVAGGIGSGLGRWSSAARPLD